MKKLLFLFMFLCVFASQAFAQIPTLTGATKFKAIKDNEAFITTLSEIASYVGSVTSSGTVTSISVASANGLAGTSNGNAATPQLTLSTSVNGMVKANGTGFSAATAGTDYVIPSGSVASLTTSRSIYGNLFNGTADLSQVINAQFGGTENGFTAFSGPASTKKTFTLPNANANIVTDQSSPAVTTNAAAVGFSFSGANLQLNLPNADASNRGTVSTASQTFAGAKTFSALITGSAGVTSTATSTQAAFASTGVTSLSWVTKTADYTLDHTDRFLEVGTLTANATFTLPACNATRNGWRYEFQKTGTDTFGAVIDPNSTETFTDGASSKTLYSQGNTAVCTCRWSGSVGTWFFQNN